MAVVYRATQLSLNRIVALKLLAPELGEDPGFRERFRREGQLQAAWTTCTSSRCTRPAPVSTACSWRCG